MSVMRWLHERQRYAIPIVVLLVLRLPSFSEPHWYTDEGGYLATAQSVLHGRTLYGTVWTNKPPLMIYIAATLISVAGTRIWALHLFTFLCSLAALSAVMWLAARHLSRRRSVFAGVLCAILLGLPLLDAELLVPESCLIAPVTWACVIVIDRLLNPAKGGTRLLLLAGLLAGIALGIQQTALAEVGFCFYAILLFAQNRTRSLVYFVTPILMVTGLWWTWAVVTAGWGHVYSALITSWISYAANGSSSSAVLSLGRPIQVILGGLLLSIGAFVLRKRLSFAVLLGLWLGLTLLTSGAANHAYAHLLTPTLAPAVLLCATFAPRAFRGRLQLGALTRVAALSAGVAIAGALASTCGLDWLPTSGGDLSINWYYAGYFQTILNHAGRQQWEDQFDPRVSADRGVVRWLRQEGLTNEKILVWSSDAWIYSLTQSPVPLPTPPIYNDQNLLGPEGLTASVKSINPPIIITDVPDVQQYPEIVDVLESSYHAVFTSSLDTIWLKN
jgi:hypothetical protein